MTDPARWLNANVHGWRDLSPHEKKAIRDFAILWPFFELNSTSQFGNPNANPQNIIRAVDDLALEPDQGRLESVRKYFADRYISGDGYTDYWQHLRMNKNHFMATRAGLVGGNRTSRDVLKALLLIANRLRNNSFHGEKARYNFADQYDNCKRCADPTLTA